MSAVLPDALKRAVADFVRGTGDVSAEMSAMSRAYRAGRSSAEIASRRELGAYLVARMPATYAAASAAMDSLRQRAPGFAPRTMIDVGAGPGTASWAAVECWPPLEHVTMLDANADFLRAARAMVAASDRSALRTAEFVQGDAAQVAPEQRYDLIVASYVLAELAVSRAAERTARLWAACDGALLIVEPGTPEGFARIRAARAGLIESGARIGAPCIGEYACPISGGDWCHFAVRLPRSRDHMRAKAAEVPFEDEKFSYVAAVRESISLAPMAARVLARPHRTKVAIRVKLCTASGVEDRIVPARDRATFKAMRKKYWGDAV